MILYTHGRNLVWVHYSTHNWHTFENLSQANLCGPSMACITNLQLLKWQPYVIDTYLEIMSKVPFSKIFNLFLVKVWKAKLL